MHTSNGPFMLDTMHVAMEDTFVYDVVMEAAHPSNGRPFLQMRVRKGSSNLRRGPQMTTDQNGRVHAWNHTHLSNDVGNWGQDFQAAQPSWLQAPVLRHPTTGLRRNRHRRRRLLLRIPKFPRHRSWWHPGELLFDGPTLDERLKLNESRHRE